MGAIGYAAWINTKVFDAIGAANGRPAPPAAPTNAPEAAPANVPPFVASMINPFGERPAVGEDGFIAMAGFPEVLVCADEQSQKDWMSSMMEQNQVKIGELMQKGLIFNVPTNSPMKVIETGPMNYRVRLVGGKYDGREVVIGWSFLFKTQQE
jgi:hypothetical protein